jgi:MerR family redox-sensitive transcriptional activator SoxR
MASELTIGEVASRSGVAPSALRFYEEEGLIVSRRTTGNQRRYERAVLRRIALIQAGRGAGIPLERIRAALATLPAHRTPTRRDWERLSRGWREDIDRRIATLEALRNRLTTSSAAAASRSTPVSSSTPMTRRPQSVRVRTTSNETVDVPSRPRRSERGELPGGPQARVATSWSVPRLLQPRAPG